MRLCLTWLLAFAALLSTTLAGATVPAAPLILQDSVPQVEAWPAASVLYDA